MCAIALLPNGAKAWLTENTPLLHYLFMEYHKFTVLFTLLLGIACTWILWKYGDSIFERQNRTVLTATCLGLMAMMFFAIGGLVSSLNVVKIHSPQILAAFHNYTIIYLPITYSYLLITCT